MPASAPPVPDPHVRVRAAAPGDAAQLLELKHALDWETSLMLLEPGERHETAQQIAADLEQVHRTESSTVLVADAGGSLAGYIDARRGEYRRNRHSAYVVIGVRSAVAGHGVGSALLRELISWGETRRAPARAHCDGAQRTRDWAVPPPWIRARGHAPALGPHRGSVRG